MRHGNSSLNRFSFSINHHSDPTYEAWKQAPDAYKNPEDVYSDPTYEAWKQNPTASVLSAVRHIPILPMRHGNRGDLIYFPSMWRIPFLPMRHGNKATLNKYGIAYDIPILPMRHGNSKKSALQMLLQQAFRSYLWGMETTRCGLVLRMRSGIPILPMRHGNWEGCATGEEARGIPILPMRHGNMAEVLDKVTSFRFRSYLWGMETLFLCVIHLWFKSIPILPMRHGNEILEDLEQIDREIPILPMRHGN